MQTNPSPTPHHLRLDPSAQMAPVVVYNNVQLPMAPVDPAQFVQELQEQRAIFAWPHHPVQASG